MRKNIIFGTVILYLLVGCSNNYSVSGKDTVNYVKAKKKRKTTFRETPLFPKTIYINPQLLVKTPSGCGAINPNPVPNESIRWTGKCKNGYLDGWGTLTWYKNGKKGTVEKNLYYRNGFELIAKSSEFNVVTTNGCSFAIPCSVSTDSLKLMKVKFKGGCGSNYQGQVDIYFNNATLARYTGKLGRANAVPVDGELEYFSGDVYKMGRNPSGYLLSGAMIEGWYNEARLLRKNTSSNAGLTASDFNIKLGFNTNPTTVTQEQHGGLFGLNIRTLNSSNDVKLNYNVQPIERQKLIKDKYTMLLEVKIDYSVIASMGMFSASNKKIIYSYVSIDLFKSNNYSAKGRNNLEKISTFQRALGLNMTATKPKINVKVVSID